VADTSNAAKLLIAHYIDDDGFHRQDITCPNCGVKFEKGNNKMNLTINGLEWLIKEVEQDEMPYPPKEEDESAWGRTLNSTCEIYLNKELPKAILNQVLIHEITHAFIFSFGFMQVDFDNEIVCDFLSSFAKQIVTIANDYMKQRKGE
jgi:hypothetical protein